jgi:hypothetical protein
MRSGHAGAVELGPPERSIVMRILDAIYALAAEGGRQVRSD